MAWCLTIVFLFAFDNKENVLYELQIVTNFKRLGAFGFKIYRKSPAKINLWNHFFFFFFGWSLKNLWANKDRRGLQIALLSWTEMDYIWLLRKLLMAFLRKKEPLSSIWTRSDWRFIKKYAGSFPFLIRNARNEALKSSAYS